MVMPSPKPSPTRKAPPSSGYGGKATSKSTAKKNPNDYGTKGTKKAFDQATTAMNRANATTKRVSKVVTPDEIKNAYVGSPATVKAASLAGAKAINASNRRDAVRDSKKAREARERYRGD